VTNGQTTQKEPVQMGKGTKRTGPFVQMYQKYQKGRKKYEKIW